MTETFLQFNPGTTLVVTGGGSGIGKATALSAARQGLSVSVWDLNEAAAHATVSDIIAQGGTALYFGLDASNTEAVQYAFEKTVADLGPVSCLAAIAGPPSFGDRDFMTGVAEAINCMRVPSEIWAAMPGSGERSAVYLSSVQGPRYGAGVAWYTVAKSAIDGYMRSQAAMRPANIRANAILPDWIYTPRTETYVDATGGINWSENPMGRLGLAQDVANVALFLLSPAAAYLNGLSIEVDGGARLRSLGWMRMNTK